VGGLEREPERERERAKDKFLDIYMRGGRPSKRIREGEVYMRGGDPRGE
jgi:hypothetical protein